ncbi:hypothetical protein DNTS_026068 [Danionella cerebrum]|uniref:Ephrin RBD domain-containing protein n=1 Tax=Danionella cerebrum TaxID=2873325 RepID=A0A553Q2P8_9TELE|nr:hypothetical protein DNTS_026068 [Danionella translucida]
MTSPHPNHAGKPCLKLKVFVKPTNGSGYESPEPFLTDRSQHCRADLPSLAVLLLLLLLFLVARV